MKPSTIFYATFCLVALAGLTAANMRGYVPFVSNAVNAARGATASFFHK